MRVVPWVALAVLVACHNTKTETASVADADQQTQMPEVTVADTVPTVTPGLRAAAVLAQAPGLPTGLNSTDAALMQQYRLTGSVQATDVRFILPTLRRDAYAGVTRIIMLVRRRQTANGEGDGPYSVAKTKQAIDELARIPADSINKYVRSGTLRGFIIMDDMACSTCWGKKGVTVSPQTADSVYRYARAKLPAALPLGIRGNPSWVAQYGPLSQSLDFAWVQYLERLGDQKVKYDREAAVARTLPHPLRVAYGVNFYHFHKNGSPITADELRRTATLAQNYPGNCYMSGFTEWADWRGAGRGAVWDDLATAGRALPTVSCKAGA